MVAYWCGFDFEVTEVFYFWFRLAGCGLVSGLNVAGFVLGFLGILWTLEFLVANWCGFCFVCFADLRC